MSEDYYNRFGGIARLYGTAALDRFRRSHVMVIGLGGVGSWAVEALARSGVGSLSLIDLDDLCLTNTNRQIHALHDTIGRSKAGVLAERCQAINPEIITTTHQRFYTKQSANDLLVSAPDLILDAIDAVRPKCHLLAHCIERAIPVITSGGAGGLRDASRVEIADLARTYNDALLQSVRKRLRSEYGFPKAEKTPRPFRIPAVFSSESPVFPQCDGSTSNERPSDLPGGIKCDAGYGAAAHLTATFGHLMAGWALEKLASPQTF